MSKTNTWIKEVSLSLRAEKLDMPRAARIHRERARTIVLGETTSELHRECVQIFTNLHKGVRV